MNDDSKRISWWRWPLVPLASIALTLLGASAITGVQDVVIELQDNYDTSGWIHIYMYPLLPCFAMGYLLAGSAFHIAPRAKLAAGMTMAGIMMAALLALAAFCWFTAVPRSDAMQVTVGMLAALAGSAFGLWLVRRERREVESTG